jgi:hypothetical protein
VQATLFGKSVMRKINIGMAVFCICLGVVCVGFPFYDFFVLGKIDPVPFIYAVGAVLAARVFWKRASTPVKAKGN